MIKYSANYGKLHYLLKRVYLTGNWAYVASEELDGDGKLYAIVRNMDDSDWRFTVL